MVEGMACNLLWLFVLHLSPELGHVFEYLMGMDYGGALVFILKKWVGNAAHAQRT